MKTILTLCLFLLTGSFVEAQTISDDVKRSFAELEPIKIDVDGDRKADTIQPRVYALVPGCAKGKPVKFSDIQHWIAFDLRWLPAGKYLLSLSTNLALTNPAIGSTPLLQRVTSTVTEERIWCFIQAMIPVMKLSL